MKNASPNKTLPDVGVLTKEMQKDAVTPLSATTIKQMYMLGKCCSDNKATRSAFKTECDLHGPESRLTQECLFSPSFRQLEDKIRVAFITDIFQGTTKSEGPT